MPNLHTTVLSAPVRPAPVRPTIARSTIVRQAVVRPAVVRSVIGRLVLVLLALGQASGAVGQATQPAHPASQEELTTTSRTIWVLPSSPSKVPQTEPSKVLVEGQPAAVFDQLPLGDGSWQIFLTVDLPLVRPNSLKAFSEWMAERADRLAELGSLTITLRGSGRSVLLNASRNADEIAGAMVELGRESTRAGEYFADRVETLAKLERATTVEKQRRVLVDHFHQEQQLLEWQHHSFMDDLLIENQPQWMRAPLGQPPSPQAVFVVRDPLGPTTMSFLESALEDVGLQPSGMKQVKIKQSKAEQTAQIDLLSQRLERAAQATKTAISGASRVISATGYNMFPVALANPKASNRPYSQSQTRRILQDATAEKLAGSSGFAITSRESLDQALSVLEAAVAVQFSGSLMGSVTADRIGEMIAVNVSSIFRGDGNRSYWVSTAPPMALTLARARRFFEGLENGPLEVEAGLLGELAGGATLETALAVESLFAETHTTEKERQEATTGRLRVSVLHQRLDQNLEIEQLEGGRQPLDKKRWLLRSPVRLPRDLDAVAVLVEDLETGRWGAAMANEIARSLEDGFKTADLVIEDSSPLQSGASSSLDKTSAKARRKSPRSPIVLTKGAGPGRSSTRFKSPVLQLVAPARDRLVGEQKFAVLLSTKSVRSVVFYLDGEEVKRDDRAPFAATLQLGPTTLEHSIRAVGYSSSGLLLGSDAVTINRPLHSQGLKITSLRRSSSSGGDASRTDSSSTLEAQATLRLADDALLDRVEFYRNQDLLATMTSPPLQADVGAPPTPDAAARGDFVRVVAWLEDGSFIEDVRLLGVGADGGLGDFGAQVQVNLVQVFSVVNDRDGNPVEGLTADDFILELGGRELTIERFSEAERVPLDLALVVDSSGSMEALIDDTRKAAARFLGDTMTDDDRAMVVDFDNTVRMVHPLTSQVFELIQSLSKLKASGATALYDSIIFALVNLEDAARNRRAVVLLTDGDDFNSRFSYGRVYESSRFAGVPLYFVALSDFFGDRRRGVRKTDLESFAKASGGRVFYVKSMEEILAAYGRISRELRSQYLLTFATEEQLSREELEKVVVKVRRGRVEGKVDVRWTVGAGR